MKNSPLWLFWFRLKKPFYNMFGTNVIHGSPFVFKITPEQREQEITDTLGRSVVSITDSQRERLNEIKEGARRRMEEFPIEI